jgi:hypothetical protein
MRFIVALLIDSLFIDKAYSKLSFPPWITSIHALQIISLEFTTLPTSAPVHILLSLLVLVLAQAPLLGQVMLTNFVTLMQGGGRATNVEGTLWRSGEGESKIL